MARRAEIWSFLRFLAENFTQKNFKNDQIDAVGPTFFNAVYDRGFAALQAVFNRMNMKLAGNSSKIGTKFPIFKRNLPSELALQLTRGYPMMKKRVFSESTLPEGLPIYDF